VTRAVVFDLDGTLVDHHGAVEIAFRRWLRRQSVTPPGAATERDFLVEWHRLERVHMDAYLAGECSFAEQRRRRLRAFLPQLGVPVPADARLDDLVLTYACGWIAPVAVRRRRGSAGSPR
jgi:putative hydrolase of the HAD superfamily